MPEGTLGINRKNTYVEYYQKIEAEGHLLRSYIRKDNIPLISALAAKTYYVSLLRILRKELETSRQFAGAFEPEKKYELYRRLSSERRSLITPVFRSIEDEVAAWKAAEWESSPPYPERRIYETERGEMVRSKSEVIIADQLFRHEDDLDYRYECPLFLPRSGYSIYPDFTVINIHTGRLRYWEHAGMMSDPQYAEDFIRKINTYAANGFIPGRDLIVTYETETAPLDISVVRKYIAYLIDPAEDMAL